MVSDGTRCVHGGHPPAALGAPLHPGPALSSTFHLGVPGDPLPRDFYGRADNPTWRALESAIGELDGGECVLFGSGMAAISAVLRTAARPGGAVVLPSDGYFLGRVLAEEELAPLGVPVRAVPTAGYWTGRVLEGASLILLETPSNPGLEVCDIAAVAALAHAAGAMVAVDNTTATPLGQRPLELGADLVVASDTTALAGHGDVVLGHVSSADPVLAGRLRSARTRGGAVPGPVEAWLAHRGLGTLDLRLERQAANARALATALREHPAVTDVRWPGLEDDPAHAVAARQMRRWNGVLRFTLPSPTAVARFLETSRLVCSATSFGGLRTTADRRERWGDAVPGGLVRLSAGCEDAADLVADVVAALDAVGR
ncbi:cystathionine gamma-lyase [Pseudonocardia asaccharolytica]|uniref:Putative cystathionine gamma-lyase n=1 Tax=Pseudonocardia asaccharolytica DSM 44247 = NBRC 16224 TaxID=1123024 RepID=A0A511DAS8_9PSEU|nr:cystathionine gamma-lyase [Pseudonocardia asaccharolytica]GEL20058.1 putative cystathionine gamma-lyase [Pseudonocardia asaccharolytica DSM 44247 = NBRC 16224]